MRGSVGSPEMPYASSALGVPSAAGFLPATVRDQPKRPSSSDDADRAQVKPVDELLVRDVGLRVAASARRQRQRRLVEDVGVAIAEAAERRERVGSTWMSPLMFHLSVVVGELLQDRVVVGRGRRGRVRQVAQHLARERGHRNRRARRIGLAGQRVAHVDRQDALALRRVGNRLERHVLAVLAEPLVVG